jgi:microcystin-dependent protein
MAEGFLGEIRMFAGNFCPRDWAACNGAGVNVQQNNQLFKLLGTTFGGDGVNSFNLPDLRGRIPVGQGSGPGLSPRSIGQSSGEESHRLSEGEGASHTHEVRAALDNAVTQVPFGSFFATVQPNPNFNVNGLYSMAPAPLVQFDRRALTPAGNGQPHNNMMFTLPINFIVAMQGMVPQQPQ